MAEQPFPLPLTDGDGIGFLSLFLENWYDGNNNLPKKLQESPPVYVSAPIRHTPPEGRSWSSPRHPHAGVLLRPIFCHPYHLAHFPHWSSHSFMASYPSKSPGQHIFLGKFIPANIRPLNVSPSERMCGTLKTKTRAGTVTRPHTKKSDFFLLHFNQSYSLWQQKTFQAKMGFVKIY